MPLEKLADAGTDSVTMEDQSLDARIRRLVRLIAAVDHGRTPGAPALSADGEARATIQRLNALAVRIRAITDEVERRRTSGDWDGGDALTARLLLEDLTAALRICRTLSDGASSRLQHVHPALRDARRIVSEARRIVNKSRSQGSGNSSFP
jgi:hypothetical protein